MVPKRELTFVLPYLGKLSFDLRTRLRRTIERDLPYCKLKIIFRSKCRLNTLFRFKDPLEKKICSWIIYCYTCSNCKVTYGKTSRHFYTRAAEHMEISNLTEKRLKDVKQSAILDHLLECNFAINFDDFSILATDCNKFKLLPKESLKAQLTWNKWRSRKIVWCNQLYLNIVTICYVPRTSGNWPLCHITNFREL